MRSRRRIRHAPNVEPERIAVESPLAPAGIGYAAPQMDQTCTDEAAARSRLAALPGLSRRLADAAELARLPGLTNRVYAVTLRGERFVLRIPGHGTDAIIDRAAEKANALAAAAAGVAPAVIHFGDDGVMLTRFIEDAAPLSPERLREDAGALTRVADALRRLHVGAPAFVSRLGPFATIDAYRRVLDAQGATLAAGARAVLDDAEALRTALAASPVDYVPCHCDPTARNLLDTGERVWLVDWEYSGMNDPWWDLSYCSFQAGLSDAADATLLAAYLGRAPAAPEAARMVVMKAPIALMSALWALIQDRNGNAAADFRAYAERVFAETAARLRSRAFREAADALRKC
jgi:thiamine kinase-like enzyme